MKLFSWLFIFLGGLLMILSVPENEALQMKSGYYEKAALELKSLVGDMLQEDFRLLDLKSMLDNGLHCAACNLITNIINSKRSYLNFNRRYMDILLRGACSILKSANLMSASECNGLVNIYSDTVLYLVNNVNDTRTICPILFQPYSCTDIPKPEYSININKNLPTPKRPSTYNHNQMSPVRVLQITDVHFDPEYAAGSNAKCMEHLCCMASNGKPRNAVDRAGYWTDYRDCDVPDYFVRNAFDHISHNDKFKYIYFTGDIISHKLWATSKSSNLRDLLHFWKVFKQAFIGYKVFPVLGNHEAHPCNLYPPDYMNNKTKFSIQWLFDASAEFWKDFLPEEALVTVRKGGYYSVSPQEGLRIISINSNIGYYYNFWLVFDDQDPYGQLQWLSNELQAAEDNGETVHILSHVTAGVEMANSWADQLRNIVRRYHNVITGIFNGHTHIDEFNLYYAFDGKPISVAFNGGSLTPYSDVNPNYKIYDIDPTTFDVLDYETYMVNLTEANLNSRKSPQWRKQYSLLNEYNMNDASPQSMHELTLRLAKDAQLRELYYKNSVRYGTPSLANGCDNDCQTKLVCNIVTTVNSDTSYCDELQKQIEYREYEKK